MLSSFLCDLFASLNVSAISNKPTGGTQAGYLHTVVVKLHSGRYHNAALCRVALTLAFILRKGTGWGLASRGKSSFTQPRRSGLLLTRYDTRYKKVGRFMPFVVQSLHTYSLRNEKVGTSTRSARYHAFYHHLTTY